LPPSRIIKTLCLLLALPVVISGCGSAGVQEMLPDQTLAYKKSREASENLELPPDLRSGTFDDALDVPPLDGGATFSEYSSGQAQRRQTAGTGDVLPSVATVELKRSGQDRWLEVDATPQQVWPRVISFWREQGILLTKQDPSVGVMQTDWLDNRAAIPQDFLRRMVSKVADGLYATSTRDQFTVRVDSGPRAGVTEVHLSHKGMEERLVSSTLGDTERTVWESSGKDSDKEAEMLRRLMIYLGASEQKAGAVAGGGGGASGGASGGPLPPAARMVREAGAPAILISDDFRRGWRLTGSALDRTGFSVEDRDMSRGTFYVRYQDADATRQKQGWTSRLAFWRKDDIDRVVQYQIRVEAEGDQSRVTVRDSAGQIDASPAADRILTLLTEQMN
jgi:outer membrane protein assembly factor BamC